MHYEYFSLLVAAAICLTFGENVQALNITMGEPTQRPYYAIEGGNFTIKCTIRGQSQGIVWYMKHNSEKYEEINSDKKSDFTTTAYVDADGLTGVLTKGHVNSNDAALYKCQAKNDAAVYKIIDIKVSRKSVGQHKRDVNSETSNTAVNPVHATVQRPSNSCMIACEVQGDLATGLYTTKWLKDGIVLVNEEKKIVIHENNNSLEILKVDFQTDLGAYICSITADNGQSYNETVYVYGWAYVKHFDKSKNLVQDDSLNLTCTAAGYPIPSVTWLHEGVAINSSNDRVSFTDYNNVANASIKIIKMQFEDAGIYSCEAINEISGVPYNSTESITVRVKDKLAALWPFLGICVEVTILCIIIFIYERHRQKKLEAEDAKEEAGHLTNSHANRDDVRQRKV